jgi:hypothetical protein
MATRTVSVVDVAFAGHSLNIARTADRFIAIGCARPSGAFRKLPAVRIVNRSLHREQEQYDAELAVGRDGRRGGHPPSCRVDGYCKCPE